MLKSKTNVEIELLVKSLGFNLIEDRSTNSMIIPYHIFDGNQYVFSTVAFTKSVAMREIQIWLDGYQHQIKEAYLI